MIASSASAKLAALLGALALHGVLIVGFRAPDNSSAPEGATPAAETRLGNSFADIAQGTAAPEPPGHAPSAAAAQAQEAVAQASAPLRPQPATKALSPSPAMALAAAPAALPATSSSSAAPLASRRPSERPKSIEAKAKPAAKPAAKPRASKQGATKKRVAGQKSGTSGAKAVAKPAPRKPAAKAGTSNAAKAYPSKVMRKIARVPKPNAGAKGDATVRFTVSASGRLASVTIARSSGSPALDKAALRTIRRAAPFPRPPAGAQRTFNIKIKGR